MKDRRVLWSEGMFLAPHHFQQWDNYCEDTLNARLNSLVSFGWGLTDLQINREGVANGHFTLLSCKGVLPDGSLLNVPESDEAPGTRTIEGHFAPAAQTLDVHLAIPTKRIGGANVRLDGVPGARPTRYRGDLLRVPDEVTGENERDVAIARKNLTILFDDESLTDYEHMKIARVKRTGDGLTALDDTYIPPSLRISASKQLMEILLRLLEILHTKSSLLSKGRGQRRRGFAEFSPHDVGNFWLLHTVNSFIPILDHYYRVGKTHPEQLFTTLAQLAGELTTFDFDDLASHPKDLPKYSHTDLGLTFIKMDETIRRILAKGIPSGARQIDLTRESESRFTGRIESDDLLVDSQVFLAATAEIPEDQLIAEIPRQAKISSIDRIEGLLGLALPGVALIHRPVPPAPLHVQLGYQYFRLENQGTADRLQHWEAIRNSRTIAIRIPNPRGFTGLKLELWSIKE